TAPEAKPSAPKASNVVDLVELLQDSLGKRGGAKSARTKASAAAEEEDNEEQAEARPKSRAKSASAAARATSSRT
ncbi:hypothetical protein QR705_25140, partial [Escherichia coli]|uniref:hypothetical protein n=1 Tax=Escherichia coli TaxID=562 RepID=UPI00256F04A1